MRSGTPRTYARPGPGARTLWRGHHVTRRAPPCSPRPSGSVSLRLPRAMRCPPWLSCNFSTSSKASGEAGEPERVVGAPANKTLDPIEVDSR